MDKSAVLPQKMNKSPTFNKAYQNKFDCVFCIKHLCAKHLCAKHLGFGLIELVTIIALIAIISSIAIPSFYSTFENMEARRIKQLVASNLALAKTESFTYRRHVILCITDNDYNCNKDADQQLIVFFDKNSNHRFDIEVDDLINTSALSLKHGRIYLRAGGRHYIKFFADTGQPRGFFGHFKYCPNKDRNDNRFQISFSQVGNVRFKPDSLYPTDCP